MTQPRTYYLLQKYYSGGWANYFDDHYTLEQAIVNIKSIRGQNRNETFRIWMVSPQTQEVYDESPRHNQ